MLNGTHFGHGGVGQSTRRCEREERSRGREENSTPKGVARHEPGVESAFADEYPRKSEKKRPHPGRGARPVKNPEGTASEIRAAFFVSAISSDRTLLRPLRGRMEYLRIEPGVSSAAGGLNPRLMSSDPSRGLPSEFRLQPVQLNAVHTIARAARRESAQRMKRCERLGKSAG